MASHDALDVAPLLLDDASYIHGHGVAVGVVFEGGRARPGPAELLVVEKVPWRNPTKEHNFISDIWAVRESGGAVLGSTQSV